MLGEKYEASRRRDKVHSFYNLQECTGSSGAQLAVLDDVSIWADVSQHDVGGNDCDILDVRAAGKRVRLCVSLRIAQFGMFWSRDCTAGNVLLGVLCGIAQFGSASLCGTAQFRMFTLVVRFLAYAVGRSSAWTVTSLSAILASNPRYRVSSPRSTTVFTPCVFQIPHATLAVQVSRPIQALCTER